MEEETKSIIKRALRSYKHWKGRIGNNELTMQEYTEISSVRYDRLPVQWGGIGNPTGEDAVDVQMLLEQTRTLRRLTMRIEFALSGMQKRERELVELRYFDGLNPSTIMRAWHVEKSLYYRTLDSAIEEIYESVGGEGIEDFRRYFERRKATA